jgi:hypothetical protein
VSVFPSLATFSLALACFILDQSIKRVQGA